MADNAKRRAFMSLIAVACVDKRVADVERRYLYRKAAEFGIPTAEADALIRQGLEGRFTITLPPTAAGKEELLKELIEVACVDGKVEQWESHMLMRFASMLGISPGDLGARVREQINKVRNEAAPPPKKVEARAEAPAAVQFLNEGPRAKPKPKAEPGIEPARAPVPLQERKDSMFTLPPGPIQLKTPSSIPLSGDLPPITRELVKNVIRFDGREEAIEYVRRTCGVPDVEKARAIVDRIIAEEPDCAPGLQKVKSGR